MGWLPAPHDRYDRPAEPPPGPVFSGWRRQTAVRGA